MASSTDYSAIIAKLTTARDAAIDAIASGGSLYRRMEIRGREFEFAGDPVETLERIERLLATYCALQKSGGVSVNGSARSRARLKY